VAERGVLAVTASWRGTKKLCAYRVGGEVRLVPNAHARSGSSAACCGDLLADRSQEWQCRPTGAYFFAMLVSAAMDP
jgi:hypothetical protein